jgi:hypothetical protein
VTATTLERIDKPRRLLIEGRLTVRWVDKDDHFTYATCKGDDGVEYNLGYDPKRKQWRCSCPARTVCSHLKALKMVVTV